MTAYTCSQLASPLTAAEVGLRWLVPPPLRSPGGAAAAPLGAWAGADTAALAD